MNGEMPRATRACFCRSRRKKAGLRVSKAGRRVGLCLEVVGDWSRGVNGSSGNLLIRLMMIILNAQGK